MNYNRNLESVQEQCTIINTISEKELMYKIGSKVGKVKAIVDYKAKLYNLMCLCQMKRDGRRYKMILDMMKATYQANKLSEAMNKAFN